MIGGEIGGAVNLVLGLFFLSLFPLRRWVFARHFRKRPDKNCHVTFGFSDVGFAMDTEGASGKQEWKMLSMARKCAEGYLIYYNSKIYNWLPNDGFESNDARLALEELLAKKVADYKEI